jgi:LPXTG-motif cell wall-anchored protein
MLTIIALSLFLVSGAHSQVNEVQNIQIGSQSWYIDSLGSLVVVGQVQNIGPDVIDQVVLTGTAYTLDGLQSTSYAGVYVAQLLPQQKAPFNIDFQPPQDSNGWYSVGEINLNVALANSTSNYQYPDLKITSSSASVGTTGNYNGAYLVSGTIQNVGTKAATNLTVVGTFFNSTGAAVGVGYTNYLEPRTLNPSESLNFQVAAFDLNQSDVPTRLKITSYSLLIQTQGPLLQGTAPISTPYVGSGDGSQNPTPTLAPGQTTQPNQNQTGSGNSQNSTIILVGAAIVVALIVIAAAFLLLKRRRKPASASTPTKPKPVYQPKPSRRNRK